MMKSANCPQIPGTMMLLTRLAKQGMRRCTAELVGMDLRLLMALSYLGDHDGIPQQELVDAFWMDAKNVVLLLNELEDGGYLIRRRDLEDRRRHRVFITDAGRDALERAARAQEEIEESVLRGLGPDERAAFRKLLIKAVKAAEPADSGARDAVAAAS